MNNLKLGIFGLRRGLDYLDAARMNGFEVTAVCDADASRLAAAKECLPDAAVYTDPEDLLGHPMDAVFLANFFHEHAPWAIRFLEKGVHVLSECAANATMAQGVQLVRAAEKSGAVYMLAENYPFMLFNREMKRVYEGGTLGRALYAEGEYNHPFDIFDEGNVRALRTYTSHWRNWLPRSYYITHSLAPLMYATGAVPRQVSALPVFAPDPPDAPVSSRCGDKAAVITTLNDDGSVFKVTGCAAFGAHGNSYRLCCENGQIENLRGMGDKVMLRYNGWQIPAGMEEINFYLPAPDDVDPAVLARFGHGGGDYFVMRCFYNAVAHGAPVPFDVYFATTMASVAILAHRSILEGGKPIPVPEFRREADRAQYENDTRSPFPAGPQARPDVPCCSDPAYAPSAQQLEKYRAIVGDAMYRK
ncbi:MAG: Gfo/Idh/MocA family oxidoreductase [Clostridia bacterium]|nr:Gfo/Idh/MocA family oxidoreductase [Clostridia bacterium]